MRTLLMICSFVGSFCVSAAVFGAELPDSTTVAGHDVVVVKNFSFSPATLHIRAGTTVTWKNTDEEPHTVVSDSGTFRSSALDEGDNFQVTFDRPGTYRFFCSVHPHMTGTIIVE